MRFLAVSALSHDGLVRDHNEDSLVVGPWTTCASTTLTPQTLAFPMDGRPHGRGGRRPWWPPGW